MKLTSYHAKDITKRLVYKNLPSLLKYNCNDLFLKYKKRYVKIQNKTNNNSLILKDNQEIIKKTIKDISPIYKISDMIKNMQYLFNYGIIRNWNNSLLNLKDENVSLCKSVLFLNFTND